MLNKIKIGPKLIGGFLIVAAIAGIIGWIGISNMNTIAREDEKLYKKMTEPLGIMLNFALPIQRARVNLHKIVLSSDVNEMEGFKKKIDDYFATAKENLLEFRKTLITKEGEALLNDLEKNLEIYRSTEAKIISLAMLNKDAEALALLNTEGVKASDALNKDIEEIKKTKIDNAKHTYEENLKLSNNASFVMLLIILSGVILAIILGLFLTVSISSPIKLITDGAKKLSIGDIELKGIEQNKFQKIIKRGDELGSISNAFEKLIDYFRNKVGLAKEIAKGNLDIDVNIASNDDALGIALSDTVASLNEVLGQVNASVEQVNTGALQVSAASQQLSQGATEQASSLEEITSSVTEINSQSRQNTDGAMKASEMANQAMEGATLGNRQMQELVLAMQDISKSAESISKISKAIDDIAFQINLLALNANVEAARAGKYGKGFAVVAEEVRNLAARSAESVKETTALIEEATKNIDKGNKYVETTAKKIEEIVGIANKVKEIADDVSLSSKEQTQGLDQVNIGLSQIGQVTQSNTASAEECASAAEELASQAEILKSLVEKFKLTGIDHTKKTDDTIHKSVKEQIKIEHIKQGNLQDRHIKIEPHTNLSKKIDTKKVVNIDDDNFGKF